MTGKQRSYLKALANGLAVKMQIGKEGITEAVLVQLGQILESKELVKVHVLENCALTAKEAANEAAESLKAEFVQAIGRKFVIYRESKDNKTIELP